MTFKRKEQKELHTFTSCANIAIWIYDYEINGYIMKLMTFEA